jgi:hypothetical protein
MAVLDKDPVSTPENSAGAACHGDREESGILHFESGHSDSMIVFFRSLRLYHGIKALLPKLTTSQALSRRCIGK